MAYPRSFWTPGLGIMGRVSGVCEGFYGEKLNVSTPTTAMPMGIIALLRAPLWLSSSR
jgi:hypothetical protein